jgi:hypothetical protein
VVKQVSISRDTSGQTCGRCAHKYAHIRTYTTHRELNKTSLCFEWSKWPSACWGNRCRSNAWTRFTWGYIWRRLCTVCYIMSPKWACGACVHVDTHTHTHSYTCNVCVWCLLNVVCMKSAEELPVICNPKEEPHETAHAPRFIYTDMHACLKWYSFMCVCVYIYIYIYAHTYKNTLACAYTH